MRKNVLDMGREDNLENADENERKSSSPNKMKKLQGDEPTIKTKMLENCSNASASSSSHSTKNSNSTLAINSSNKQQPTLHELEEAEIMHLNQHREMSDYFKIRNIDLNLTDNHGRNIFHHLAAKDQKEVFLFLWHRANDNDRKLIKDNLLLEFGDFSEQMKTHLNSQAKSESGIDVSNVTPLELALHLGNREMVEMLCDKMDILPINEYTSVPLWVPAWKRCRDSGLATRLFIWGLMEKRRNLTNYGTLFFYHPTRFFHFLVHFKGFY